MRVIGGDLRGRPLKGPKGQSVRPTPDRVREALFNMVDVEDARVLDICAGTGAIGIEALSRGATKVVFVDVSAQSVRLIRQNLEALGVSDRARVLARDLRGAVVPALADEGPFDFIFADPPYRDTPKLMPALVNLATQLLAEDGLMVVEHNDELPELTELRLDRSKKYGDTRLAFLTKPLVDRQPT